MMDNKNIMPNFTEKAIVPYCVPQASEKRFAFLDKIESYFENVYSKRYRHYYVFIALSFVLAIVAAEVFSRFPQFADYTADELIAEYRVVGLCSRQVLRFLFSDALFVFFAFLAGFTVFSLPVSILSFSRLMLSAFYLFANAVTSVSHGIYNVFALICVFSSFVFLNVLFFTETAAAYKTFNLNVEGYSPFLRYCLYLIVYIFAVVLIFDLGITLILPH